MKIAIVIGDFFLSNLPYDGLDIYDTLKNHFDVDLIMFQDDIRLLKSSFEGCNFYFDKSEFVNRAPRIVNSWGELMKIIDQYDVILSSTHIAPKTRYPHEHMQEVCKKKWFVWDIGGADILTNPVKFTNKFLVKGQKWKSWLKSITGTCDNNIFVTGTPHYDEYFSDENNNIQEFILVTPSNPNSHTEMFSKNIQQLEKLILFADNNKLEVVIKTHPSDYLFYENEKSYSGVYRRANGMSMPQWLYLQKMFGVKIAKSNDHFKVMKTAKFMYNMSGSHIAWETKFTKRHCFTTNHKTTNHYKKVNYLKDVEYPDDIFNIELSDIEQIQQFDIENARNFEPCDDFIINQRFTDNIVDVIKLIGQ